MRVFLPRGCAAVPDAIWGPVVAGLLVLMVGGIGLAVGQPWLFTSLGPTAYVHSETPKLKSSRFYNTFVGHMVGLGCGFLAVAVLNAWSTPPVMATGTLTPPRLWAATLAVGATLAVNTLLHASHAPAATITLLVALGTFHTAHDARVIFIGVSLLAVFGEITRQIRVRATSSPRGY